MKEDKNAFEKKLLDMDLTPKVVITKEEEENAWKEILWQVDRQSKGKSRRWQIAAALILLLGVAYLWLLPTNNSFVTDEAEVLNITLPDGSFVAINSNSKLDLHTNFSPTNRTVSLQGEAFFNIKSDPTHPFLIAMNDRLVTVPGTSFSVWHREGITKVGVVSGLVQVQGKKQTVRLIKDQEVTIDIDGNVKTDSLDMNSLAWYKKVLTFKDKTLKEAMQIIAANSAHPIAVDPNVENCKLSLRIRYEQIEEVYDIIAETLGLQWKLESNQIKFYGEGC